MKKSFFQEIEIPEGVEVEIDGTIFKVKGEEGENQREFRIGKVKIEKKENKIIIGHAKSSKKEKRIINTVAAHVKNMIKGVQEKFKYNLKIVSSHFPISVELKGNIVTIKNFLGEKIPREAIMPENAEVQIEKDLITIKSIDKEIAGQTAANFEAATKIRNKDRRVFQDGIYMINKAGKEI